MSLRRFADQARTLGPTGFTQRFAGQLFLIKRARDSQSAAAAPEVPAAISYRTTSVRMSAEDIDAHDVFGPGLCVWPLIKRPDNPYPDRVSVGRATNCDIVLRAPYLSKLHAHFSRNDAGAWRVADNGSANGTRVNSEPLQEGSSKTVRAGDRICFGGLDLELVGPEELYELLRS